MTYHQTRWLMPVISVHRGDRGTRLVVSSRPFLCHIVIFPSQFKLQCVMLAQGGKCDVIIVSQPTSPLHMPVAAWFPSLSLLVTSLLTSSTLSGPGENSPSHPLAAPCSPHVFRDYILSSPSSPPEEPSILPFLSSLGSWLSLRLP